MKNGQKRNLMKLKIQGKINRIFKYFFPFLIYFEKNGL